MTTRNSPPAEGVSVELLFRLSRKGRLDALRHGIQADEWDRYWVTPDDPLWDDVIALEPTQERLKDSWGNAVGWRNRLIAGRPYSIRIENGEPEPRELIGELWFMPEVNADDSEDLGAIEPFDEYPSVADLIHHERDRIDRRDSTLREIRENRLDSWRSWVAGWTARLPKVAAELGAADPDSVPVRHLAALVAGYALMRQQDRTDVAADQLIRAFDEVSRQLVGTLARRQRADQLEAELDEAARWISRHGSSRLQKTVAAGLLENSLKVYRDERLAADRPGWAWLDEETAAALRPVLNPSEQDLNELLDARSQFNEVELKFWRRADGSGVTVLVSPFLGRRIFSVAGDVFARVAF